MRVKRSKYPVVVVVIVVVVVVVVVEIRALQIFHPHYSPHSPTQVRWLNNYHKLTQDTMEPLLTTELAKAWLRTRTRPYEVPTNANSASAGRSSVLVVMATVAMAAASVTLTSPLL